MPLIALEFLDDQILVATTRPGKTSRLEIQKLFSIPLTGNEEASEASIAAALKKGLAQHRLTRAEAILVLKRTSVEIREMVVPPAPDNELPGMVRMMAASKFSSFHDDAILDFIVRGTDTTAPRDVLAFLLAQKSYERITRIASEAGIKIRQIVLRPLATVQLASPPSSNAKPTLLIDAGPDEADLTLFSEKGLLTTRTVRLPTEGPQRETALLREIQRTLVSSSDPTGDRPQASLVLIDDSQWSDSFLATLRSKFETEVERLELANAAPFSSRCEIPKDLNRYAGLIGGLAGAHRDGRPWIDFAHPRQPVVEKKDHHRLLAIGGVALVAALLIGLFGWWTLRTQANNIARLQDQLNEAIKKNSGDHGKQDSIDQILAETATIDQWKVSDVNWLEELYQYSNRLLTPDDAIVDTLEAGVRKSDPKIMVKCRVAGVSAESRLLGSLGSRPYQVETRKSSASVDDENYPMALDISLTLPRNPDDVIEKVNKRAAQFRDRP